MDALPLQSIYLSQTLFKLVISKLMKYRESTIKADECFILR
ncbi:hypothetical protein FDUTEX481_00379 [Tolypothrix sp. PCC 7601]|nr:hypothetical protein FDUTEX481_00379 [Tolypothrix sp. PCC 7601]